MCIVTGEPGDMLLYHCILDEEGLESTASLEEEYSDGKKII